MPKKARRLLRRVSGLRLAVPGITALLLAASLAAERRGPAAGVCRPSDASAADIPTEPMTATPCVGGFAGPYPCSNVDLEAFVPLATMGCEAGNSLWGWTDSLDGREYALMGCDNGISFVDITVPDAPVYLGRLQTHTHPHLSAPQHEGDSIWRDVRVANDHAYVVSEAEGHGLQVFDLTQLRGIASPPVAFEETAHYDGISSTHTVAVNEESNFIYLAGTDTCNGGLHMLDVSEPAAPAFAGCVAQDGYVHETQCAIYHGPDAEHDGDEICFNANEDTLTIVDVTNKAQPVQLSRTEYAGSGYTHQAWMTEDHAYLLLNDELDEVDFGHNSYTYIWDLSDLEAPILKGHYTGPTPAIDHNLYVRGGYAFESNYRAGLRILDATAVSATTLTEAGFFDIWPSDDAPEFNANWNNYPFFPSGRVILSGIEQGLFILKPNLNPFPTSILVADAEVAEGDSGSSTLTFPVTLTRGVPGTVTVHYATAFGSATAGSDYTAVSGTLTFDPGVTSRPVEVTVFGDALDETDETIQLHLSDAVNATIADVFAVAEILDDDPLPALAVSDVSVTEGDGPGSEASVTVTLSAPSGRSVSALLSTADGTATGSDYTPRAAAVSFAAGVTEQTFDVPLAGDDRDEADEFFVVDVTSPTNASLSDAQATATILDDDTLLVASVSPTSGTAAGGVEISIGGESFEDGAGVSIGGLPAAAVTVPGTGEILATTPALSPGALHDVAVTVPGLLEAVLPGGFFADFLDVDALHPFHDFVESLLRAGITAGCGSGDYCPASTVTRAQMAVFLIKAGHGSAYTPPACSGVFDDVPCPSPFANWIEQLAAEGVTGGCGGNDYCPAGPVTRAQMAVFLLKTRLGPAYTPPAATGVFGDVPVGSFAADWIEDLYARGVTGGCSSSPLLYCPDAPSTRGQMAVFLTRTFPAP